MISIFFSLFFGKIFPKSGGAVYCVGSRKTRKLALIRRGCLTGGGLFGTNSTVSHHFVTTSISSFAKNSSLLQTPSDTHQIKTPKPSFCTQFLRLRRILQFSSHPHPDPHQIKTTKPSFYNYLDFFVCEEFFISLASHPK